MGLSLSLSFGLRKNNMIETVIGIVFGGLLSWIIAHWYFKKQEQTLPVSLINNIDNKIQELREINIKTDDKLQKIYESVSI